MGGALEGERLTETVCVPVVVVVREYVWEGTVIVLKLVIVVVTGTDIVVTTVAVATTVVVTGGDRQEHTFLISDL